MSVRVMTSVWEHGPGDATDRYVLLALADNANDEGHAYPSITALSAKTQFAPRTVMRSLESLEYDGWIKVKRRARQGKFSEYQILMSAFSGDRKSLNAKSSDTQSRDTVSPERGESGDRKSRVTESRVTESRDFMTESGDSVSKSGDFVTESGDFHDNPPHPLIGRTIRNHQEPSENLLHEAAHRAANRQPATRFTPFRIAFEKYFRHKTPGVEAPWDGKEAAALSRWLKANPAVTEDQWRRILQNRARSDVAHSIPLSQWINRALSFVHGTADEFGKQGGRDGRRNRAETALESALEAGRNALARIDEKYGPGAYEARGEDGRADGPGRRPMDADGGGPLRSAV